VGVGDSSSFAACFFFSGSGVSLGEGFAVVSLLCLAAFAFGVGLGDSSGDASFSPAPVFRSAKASRSFPFCAWPLSLSGSGSVIRQEMSMRRRVL